MFTNKWFVNFYFNNIFKNYNNLLYFYYKKIKKVCFLNLYDSYCLNKLYKNLNFCSDILSFKNEKIIFLCDIIIEKKSKKNKLNIYKYYINILIHGLIHLFNMKHNYNKKIFFKLQYIYIL